MFQFTITARDNRARTGIISTPHGDLITPVFAPIGALDLLLTDLEEQEREDEEH